MRSRVSDGNTHDAGSRNIHRFKTLCDWTQMRDPCAGRTVGRCRVSKWNTRIGANVESDMSRVSRAENGDAAVGDRDGVRSRQRDIASGSEEAARDNRHAALGSNTTNPATDLSALDIEAIADLQRVDARLGRCSAHRHHDRGTQGRTEYPVQTVYGHDRK
jgi:hypothetical protein